MMEKIASFSIDHVKLQPGIYVSRKDKVGDQVITTFDLRMTSPNEEPVMNTAELHTLEHLAATYLRIYSGQGDKVIYFGPMGCRTGCYFLMAGDYGSRDILDMIIPGTEPKDCGNCLDHNLDMAKYVSRRYLEVLYHIDGFPESRLVYPEQ